MRVILCAYFLASPILANAIELAQTHTLKSEFFGAERTVGVFLPAIYGSNPQDDYPVIYVVRG